jgi:UDP-glucose 4-epimerase
MNVRYSIEDPLHDAQINILGLLNVLNCCIKTQVKKIIFISSGGAMYGDAKAIPTPESTYPEPLSPYGLAKFVGEEYVKLYARLYGLKYSILRYANVYGPRQNPKGEAGVVAIFIDRILQNKQPIIYGDGNQTRDYVYVMDLVEANLLSLTKGNNQAFNIGTGKQTSVNELLKILLQVMNKQTKPIFEQKRQGEVEKGALDCTAAKKILEWDAKHTLQQGLQKTVEGFK